MLTEMIVLSFSVRLAWSSSHVKNDTLNSCGAALLEESLSPFNIPPNNHIKCQVFWSDLHQYYHNFDIGKVGTAFSAMIEAQIALRSSVVKSSNQTQYIGFDFAQIYIKNDCSHCSRLFTGVHRLLESFSLLGLHPGFGRSPQFQSPSQPTSLPNTPSQTN